MSQLDDKYWLQGDEDCGVSLQCRSCDLGGQPIAYYGHDNAYERCPRSCTWDGALPR